MMSELPIVQSSGRCEIEELDRIERVDPARGPQSGRESIQAKRAAWSANADRTAGISR